MKHLYSFRATTINTEVSFWPSFVDMLISVLMIFLLIGVLKTPDPEALRTRQKQEEFRKIFESKFSKEIKDNSISIQEQLNLLKITFSDKILFESGQYELLAGGKEVLGRCAKIFRTSEAKYEQIQVEGHTDDTPVSPGGYPSDNWELSAARAISVVRFFTNPESPDKLDPTKLSANGYAFYRPVSLNDKSKNRRIEILIIFFTPKGRNEVKPPFNYHEDRTR